MNFEIDFVTFGGQGRHVVTLVIDFVTFGWSGGQVC